MEDRASRHRLRLLEGMSLVVARKGYAAVTIADVVAEAGVSKRTFYEHFSSKEDCLLACYVEATSVMMAAIRQQLWEGAVSGRAMISALHDTYLAFLDRAPLLAATMLIEVRRAGAQARRTHRQINRDFALLICDSVAASEFSTELFDLDQSIALVGGVNELVLTHAEDEPDVPFSTLRPAVQRFVHAVIGDTTDRVGS
jgi:AcrR family transcriptional regulator